MDFELTDDQVALTEGIRSLCRGRFAMDTIRALMDQGGIDRGLWSELAATGVFSLVLPEADGGVGLGMADAALVFAELGRAAVPGPLVATFLAAESVAGGAEGDTIVGLIDADRPGPILVEHFESLDRLCLLSADGVSVIDPAVLDAASAGAPLDPLTPVHVVEALPSGEPIGDRTIAEQWRVRGTVLVAAQQLGLAEAALDLAVDYAKERQQFGKAIGAFQAVKHLCADMLTLVEVARAAVLAAAVTIDQPEVGDPHRAASVAKITADHAASQCGKSCVQVHGGMGYTWEVHAHLLLKRAWALESAFGDSDHHAERMAARLT